LSTTHGAATADGAPVRTAGLHRVGSGWLAVPAGVDTGRPLPLVVALHGAGSSGRAMVDLLGTPAARAGFLLLAPDARGTTWDLIEGGFGPDVARLDATLREVYGQWRVDPGRTVLAGFSDGASYALSLGIGNGDRFSHLVAFSPGFMAPDGAHGRPSVYVSHGREDPVLPIDACSRRLVPALRAAGYDVRYTEFDGGHAVPAEISQEAFAWVEAVAPNVVSAAS
jgi:phospholipase/carboxylesterase